MPERAGRPPLSAAPAMLLVVALLAGAWPGPVIAAGTPGDSRSEPVPLGAEVAAGPLRIGVGEVLVGEEANAAVAAAAPTNEPQPDGVDYVVVEVSVRNAGDRPETVDPGDFAVAGASGVVGRFASADPPEPALGGVVAPGETLEGWIVLPAPADETGLLLLFDSLSLPGAWADRVFALEEGAAVPEADAAPAEPNDAGVDSAEPAGIGTPVVTADWQVELLEVATGAEVFALVDYRTGALGPDDATGNDPDGSAWVALRLRITNVRAGGEPDSLPPNAFALVDEAGDPLPDLLTLTPPNPDAAGTYYPGATRDGWVAFDVSTAYAADTVRFLPYATDRDPRYLTYG